MKTSEANCSPTDFRSRVHPVGWFGNTKTHKGFSLLKAWQAGHLPIGLRSLLMLGAVIFSMVGINCAGAEQGDVCLDNSYVPNPYPGSIFVSDAAITYSYSNCPRSDRRLGQQVKLRVGQSLYFWFRLQGDRNYLSSSQSYQPFRLNFYRDNGSVLVDQGYLGMGNLDRSAMISETQTADGQFDWRLGAEKWTFSIPGSYTITLSQQQTPVACNRSSLFSSPSCSWQIEVVP